MDAFSGIKGFMDMFPPDSTAFTRLEESARRIFGSYGYDELRTPLVEYTDLFKRSIGTETDVVQKEMFTFPDRKGRLMTLRPEATAGVVRAYVESKRHSQEAVSRLFTTGPMFRYERPQKGRSRQFHQLNCECLGSHEPYADAEMIGMLVHFFKSVGITDVEVLLNSLGCKECRPGYKTALTEFFEGLDREALCEDCQRRLHANPMRLLDCKVPGCRAMTENAPLIGEYICPDCAAHFNAVRRLLDAAGVNYALTPRLVRGLDYYVRTTFEVVSGNIGSQSAIAGGGRYDGLVAQLGGPDVPGIGFACGMERLALLLPESEAPAPDFYIAALDEAALDTGFLLAQKLRRAGFSGETAYAARSAKSHLRQAAKNRAAWACILGSNELAQNSVMLKNMASGEQRTLPLAPLAELERAMRT